MEVKFKRLCEGTAEFERGNCLMQLSLNCNLIYDSRMKRRVHKAHPEKKIHLDK